MKRSASLSKLITLAKIARQKTETLSRIERGVPNLTGYCGVASKYLETLANKNGIYPQFVAGIFQSYNRIIDRYGLVSGHSWLEHDGYIIDITATQFRNVVSKVERNFNKKVYICRTTNPHYKKTCVGGEAKLRVRSWYMETLEEICEKIEEVCV